MRLIDADELTVDAQYTRSDGVTVYVPAVPCHYIKLAPTVNAIPIPNNATNGDVIKALFPDCDVNGHGKTMLVLIEGISFEDFRLDVTKDWWNAPYKKEQTDGR